MTVLDALADSNSIADTATGGQGVTGRIWSNISTKFVFLMYKQFVGWYVVCVYMVVSKNRGPKSSFISIISNKPSIEKNQCKPSINYIHAWINRNKPSIVEFPVLRKKRKRRSLSEWLPWRKNVVAQWRQFVGFVTFPSTKNPSGEAEKHREIIRVNGDQWFSHAFKNQYLWWLIIWDNNCNNSMKIYWLMMLMMASEWEIYFLRNHPHI